MTRTRHPLDSERGQILMIAALFSTALLGMIGLIVDGGFYYSERRQLQNAADHAALAAAYTIYHGGSSAQAQDTANEYALANGYEADQVTFHHPPASGPHQGDPGFVEVIIEEQPPTFFIHVLLEGGGVSARGVSQYVMGSGGAYAMFANRTSCGDDDNLNLPGSSFDVTGAIHSNSTMIIGGSDNDFEGAVTHVCDLEVSGSGNSFNPSPTAGSTAPFPVDYEWDDFLPHCDFVFNDDTDLTSVNEAWVGGDSDSGELIPGVYCSEAKLSLSSSDVTGEVTLVARDGMIAISGSNFNLTPHWNNVLAFTEFADSSAMDLSGSGGSWEGLVIAPNGKVKLNGSSNLSISGSILADTIEASGSSWSLSAMEDAGSGAPIIRLVE